MGRDGRITVTVEAEEKSLRYQGIVPLTGASLAESLEAYFASSEQLPTRVVLAADTQRAAGMLVQKLPGPGGEADESSLEAWADAAHGMGAVDAGALLAEPAESVLMRAFPGNDVRLFRGTPVRFECRCNAERVAGVLRALGPDEIRDVLREQGAVTVTCEFCHRPYRFDSIDIEALFSDPPPSGSKPLLH